MNWFVFCAAFSQAAYAASPSAREIMAKNEEARRLKEVIAEATLVTQSPKQDPKSKRFSWSKKLSSDQIHFFTMTRFHSPAEVRDEGILFLERSGGQNEILLYLPAYKKIRRVETQDQKSSFMGSEFSYSDVSTPHLDDYTYRSVKEEPCPTDAKISCYVIESTPANDTIKKRTGYLKSHGWIRKDNFMLAQAEFFEDDGKGAVASAPFKRMIAPVIQEVDPKTHQWMATKIEMENLKNKKKTALEFKNVKVNSGIPDRVFTEQSLARP